MMLRIGGGSGGMVDRAVKTWAELAYTDVTVC